MVAEFVDRKAQKLHLRRYASSLIETAQDPKPTQDRRADEAKSQETI